MGMDMYLDAQAHKKNKQCDECENKDKLIIHITTRSEINRVPWYVCDKCFQKRYSDDFYEKSAKESAKERLLETVKELTQCLYEAKLITEAQKIEIFKEIESDGKEIND